MASFEEVLTQIRTLRQVNQDTYWSQGDLLLAAEAVFGAKGFCKAVASELGCSARHVSMLMRTAKAFPVGTRAADMTWELHRLCAMTKEPEVWLARAIDNAWSIADLKEAIAREKEPGLIRDKAEAEAERIIRQIRRYAETYTLDAHPHLAIILKTTQECYEETEEDPPMVGLGRVGYMRVSR